MGQNIKYLVWSQETDRPWTDRTEQRASKEECIKWNRSRRNTHSRFQGLQENQKESISKFRRPSKLADKVNWNCQLSVEASSEKVWLLYEFSFSLNPGDKPNDAQAWKNYSSLYPVSTEDQFQEHSKKSWWNILRQQNKAYQILASC